METNININIYKQMCEVADELMQNNILTSEAGEFNAKDIHKGLGTTFLLAKDENGPDLDEIVTHSCGTFTCSYRRDDVFNRLAKWEKLVPSAMRVKFSKRLDIGTPLLKVVKPKEWKALIKCASKEPLRPILTGIMLEVKTMTMFASDGRILMACGCPGYEVLGEVSSEDRFVLPPEIFNCKEDEIIISSKDGKLYASCGNTLAELVEGRYPNVHAVIPNYHMDECLALGDEKWFREFKKNVRGLAKLSTSKSPYVTFSTETGSSELRISLSEVDFNINATKTMQLPEPAKMDARFALRTEYIAKVPDASFLCVRGCDSGATFVTSGCMTLLMPVQIDDGISSKSRENRTENPFSAAGFKEVSLERIEEQQEIVTEIRTEVIEETAEMVEQKQETPNLPAVIYKIDVLQVPKPVETEPVVETTEPIAVEIETNQTEQEREELQTVNGMTVGDFVKLNLPTGYSCVCKIFRFIKDGEKVTLNVKGWHKWSFPISSIEPTDEKKNSLPEWIAAGQNITNGTFTEEIVSVERSKVNLANGEAILLKQVLMNCRPCAKVIQMPEPQKKENKFIGWLRKLAHRAAIFSF